MKAGWQRRRFGEVCDLKKGKMPALQTTSAVGVKPYLVAKYLRGSEPTEFASVSDRNSVSVSAEEIIIICDGSNSGETFIGFDGILSSTMAKIGHGEEIDNRFLMHFMDSLFEKFNAAKTGTAIPHLDLAALREEMLPLPPVVEQHRIVAILDEAFDGIATVQANAEKNLQNARALFESHLHTALQNKKWRWKTLGDLCDGVEYGSSAKSKKEGKVPVLRMGNIQDGQLDWENLVYTDDKDEIKKYLLKYNDVLFNRTNSPELVGKSAIYKSEMPAIFAGYLIRIQRKEDLLDGDYLNYFLNSQIARDYGKTVVISSVNQANINGTKLKGYPIPAASLSEQKAIVKELDGLQEETQRLEYIYQQKLTALDDLKKALLHQAFSGAL